jgi:DNA-binding transcriptional ArsR family regulator
MAPRTGRKNPDQMNEVFKALAEPQRIAILRLVHDQELPAGEIASHFKTTRQAISQHLRLLSNAGLLELRRDGTRRLYRVNTQAFGELRTFLDIFWNQSLSSLKRRVEEEREARRGVK